MWAGVAAVAAFGPYVVYTLSHRTAVFGALYGVDPTASNRVRFVRKYFLKP